MLPVEIPTGDGSVFFFDAGAVILIILAIILVPRLLGGSKKKDTTAPKPAPAVKAKPAPTPKPAPKPAPAVKAKPAPNAPAAKPNAAAKPAPKPKVAPKPAQTPKPQAASAPQAGLFEGAKSFVKERKETAADESAMVLSSPMTRYAADAFVNALQEIRPQLAATATHSDYFEIDVSKSYCRLNYYAYDPREYKYRFPQVITEVTYKTIHNLFRWENDYEQIASRKAKAELKDFLMHECIAKTGFLILCSADRLGLLISQM